jgi:RimJ/RimL family protein N-acetyltransferase
MKIEISILETERLILRRFCLEDWKDLHEYLSDPEVVCYEPYEVFTESQSREEAARRSGDGDFWAVSLKDGGKVIGNLYLSAGEFHSYELGYVFNRAYQGQGYATESARTLIKRIFDDGAHRVTAMCNPENVKSWRLLERLGFEREGHLRRNVFFRTDRDGRPVWQDTFIYGLLGGEA